VSHIFIFLLFELKCSTTRFADRDMFVRFTGGGIGHRNTAFATKTFREPLLNLFGLNFNDDPRNDQEIDDPNDGENFEDGSGEPAEDEEWENIESDIDDEVDSTDFEGDGGECGGDEEDELGFAGF
jgi:hypothetical protein